MAHSKEGSVGIVALVAAVLLICLIPAQISIMKALSERLYIERTKDLLGTALINSMKYLDSERLGCGKLSFDKSKAGTEIMNDIKNKLNRYPDIRVKGNPDVEIIVTGNTVEIRSAVSVYSISGRIEKISVENSFILDISEEE